MTQAGTVLLLHSFGSAGRSWNAVRERLDALSDAPDLPGFGAAPPLAAPSVAAYADWVEARMHALGGAVVLVGASMGGKMAMAVAQRRPAGLCGLVLCAPSPPTPEPIEAEERARQLATWGDREAASRSMAASTLAPPSSPVYAAAMEDWLRTDRRTWDWWWGEGSREAIAVDRVPRGTLVLAGTEDGNLGPKAQRARTTALLAGAVLHAVAGAGHLLALDAPDAVAHAIECVSAKG